MVTATHNIVSPAGGAEPAPVRSDAELVFSAAMNAAKLLDVPLQALCDILHMPSVAALRKRASRSGTAQSAEAMLALMWLRVARSLGDLFGPQNIKQQQQFLHSSNRTLGVPLERMRTLEGLAEVAQYIDAYRGR